MTFDITKCKKDENGHLMARTRNGTDIRLICTNAPGGSPLIGYEKSAVYVGIPSLLRWRSSGVYPSGVGNDLELNNLPEEHTVTVFRRWNESFQEWVTFLNDGDRSWEWAMGPGFKPGPRDSRLVIILKEGEGL